MTRSGFRTVAAVAAVAVLAALLWLLSSPDAARRPDADHDAPAATPRGESPEAAEAREAAAGGPGGARESRSDPASDESRGAATPAVHHRIRGVCVLEDGTPLVGIRVQHGPGGKPVGWEGEEGKEIAQRIELPAGLDGAFDVPRYRDSITIVHAHAEVIAVEGGTLEFPPTDRGVPRIVVPPGTGDLSLRVVFRDKPGTAHVRLFDSSTQQPITDLRGFRLSYLLGGDLSGRAVYDFAEDTGLGGWIPIREGALPEDLAVQADPGTVVVEFAALGYAPARVGLLQIRGRMSIGVNPVPPCVTGEVLLHPREGSAPMGPTVQVSAQVRRAEGDAGPPATEARGLPSGDGPFRVDDLAQGAWVLEVSADMGGTLVRAKREFEYRGSPVDLGDILLQRGAAVRVRAVDAAGTPMPQARLVVVRDGEDPEKAKVLVPGPEGWASCADLEPGAAHRAVALGMPRPLEKPVRTSPDRTRVEVELSWPERLVPCRISLIVDGKAVANPDGSRTIPATVHESPLPRESGAWHADGTFEAKLVPGTYRFSVYATPEGGGDLVLFAGEVTVPAGDAFETRVELTREGR